ncbi:ABC transporter permease [Cytobacillus massiliigabonensis]|uniref:ABC transporter permease n=1 Tax=Cytobacillus massiliigabonensis TaxID=1871011 RepID=UPI000C8534FD|nr:ABC transporter permease [Cytobacillus massiliigabonensis]
MRGIIWGKFRLLLRKPGAFIATTIICIAFAYLLGKSSFTKVEVPVYSSLPEEEVNEIVEELNKGDSFSFVAGDEKEVKNKVASGNAEAGISLDADFFTIYQVGNTENFHLINQYVERYYLKRLQEKAVIDLAVDSNKAIEKINEVKENHLFELSVASFSDDNQWVYDPGLQSLFGFALFFSIYTVAFNVVEILREKQLGIWDRLILSSTTKLEMYVGNLLYCFFIGYLQISLIFVVFKFGAGVDFYGSFGKTLILIIPYLFSIVALSIFLTGIVKTIGQFNALVPLISVSFAMLGGAYWPIEIITSETLLTISKAIPITYGMELLKGATISGLSYSELLYPVSILILMGVVMMGIGIRLMERRHV